MCLRTSLVGDSPGSKHTFSGLRIHYAVLPTKTSLWFIQFGGSPLSFSRACSQVFTTSVLNPSFLLTLVAVILLIVSVRPVEVLASESTIARDVRPGSAA